MTFIWTVVYQFLQGESPEGIVQAFPSLSLLQTYGGITCYLAHRAEVDEYLKRGEARFEELARAAREANPLLYPKLEAPKHATSRGVMPPKSLADENFNARPRNDAGALQRFILDLPRGQFSLASKPLRSPAPRV